MTKPKLDELTVYYFDLLTADSRMRDLALYERGRTKVGLTPQTRASWLLTFLKKDLNNPGIEIHDHITEVALFLEARPAVTEHEKKMVLRRLPRIEQLRDWQKNLAHILRRLKNGQPFKRRVAAGVHYSFKRGKFTEESALDIDQGTEWPFILKALRTLSGREVCTRICARRDCASAFIASRKQKYCSKRCGQTVKKRIYRGRQLIGTNKG